MRRSAKLSVITSVTAATLAAGIALAPSASADPFRCGSAGSDPRAWCAYVKDSPNGLTIRTGPGTGYSRAGTLNNGQRIEIDCWGYGSSVGGYNIWAKLYSPSGNRWVSDLYLTTGRIQNFLSQC
ncbi:SH3 domain-containing protein [Streptomyces sp. NPDC127033]|uniref:SH3 domain-containing protein n=1 Tax=Streptomyces sp. NPDC127033 TaxID=3347110 RepID=UPI00364B1AD7